MKHVSILACGIGLMLAPFALSGSGSPARAAEVPDYLKTIVGTETATPAEIGIKNMLQLNTSMFELYDNAGKIFRKNFMATHPVILGLFSGAGGRFILYRPGMPPLEAPSVPLVYQLMKSVGHSTMALAEVVTPYVNSPNDTSWRGALAAYRSRMQAALDTLDATPIQDDWKPTSRSILQNNIAFMDESLTEERNHAGWVAGVRQEARATVERQHRLGRGDPGQSLDERDRGMEADARRRLGQDLRGQQHDLRRPPEQCSVTACLPSFSGPMPSTIA